MKRALLCSLGVFTAGILVGCAGSSGSPVIPAGAMRKNVVGDSWVYLVTTNLPNVGSGSGIYTQALTADTYLGKPSVRSSGSFDLKYPDGIVILGSYDELAQNGTLLATASQGSLVPVKSETFSLPGTISLATNAHGTLTLSDGLVVQQHYQVVGAQQVTVPAGTFNCWVVQETNTYNNGTKDNFTLYLDPTVGNWVQADNQTLYANGTEFDWHAQLSSMTTKS